jgi:hypothetical protein
MGANASRYRGKAPDEIVWAEPERRTRARHSTLFPDGDMRRDAGARFIGIVCETATSIWTRINLLNLRENILPTRRRADLILKKVESHLVEEVALRAQEYVGQFLATFTDFPPRQKAASFNMDEVLAKLKDAK